jgi:hypothetical protein
VYVKRTYSSRLLKEKFIFFLAATVFAIIGYYSQTMAPAVGTPERPLHVISLICYQILFYLEKLFLPISLSSFYPYPRSLHGDLPNEYFISIILVFLMGILMWRYGRKNNPFVFGFLFFFILILPVLQIVRFSGIIAADRFTYISYFGLLYFIGYSISRVLKSSSRIQCRTIQIALIAGTIAFSITTYDRCKVWENGKSLWEDVFRKYPNALGPVDESGHGMNK